MIKNKKQHINPFWGPNIKAKGLSSFGFKPIRLNTSNNVRNIPKRNLTWAQASIRFPRLNPFGDSDRDGKLNMFDCRPFDRRRHGKLEREEIRTNYGIQKKPTRFQKHIIRIIEKDPILNRELKGVKITTNTDGFAGKYSVNFKNIDEAINLNPNRYYKGYAAEEDVSLKQAIIHEQKHRERAQDILKSNITPKEKSKRFIERFRDEIGGEGTGIYQTNVIEENEAVRAQRTPTSIDIIRAKKRDILQQEGSTPEALKNIPNKKYPKQQNIPISEAKYVTAYHGTSREMAERIMKEGLKTPANRRLRGDKVNYSNPIIGGREREDMIFATTIKDVARQHAREKGYPDKGGTVLQVKIDPTKDDVDLNNRRRLIIKGDIPTSRIKEIKGEALSDFKRKALRDADWEGDESKKEIFEEQPEALERFEPKNKRLTNETESHRERRIRHGATEIKEIDATEFKKKFEEQHEEKLDWNERRLDEALTRNEDDAFPEVSISKDKVDVGDGRHRISAAAERGQKIDVAIVPVEENKNEK